MICKIEDIIKKVLMEDNKNNFSTSNKSFSFKDNIFYSYNEPIAELEADIYYKRLKLFPKCGQYDVFISKTTSRHIMTLKKFCENNNIDYII